MGSLITDVAYFRGIIAGFALAAPLGPVAVLCIRRCIARGQIEGILAGMSAALADTLFGAAAGLGITIISAFIATHETVLGFVGGATVLVVGIVTYRTPVCSVTGEVQVSTLRQDMAAAFTMAITNPATMLGAAGIFAAFGPVDLRTQPIKAFWLVFGVFCGSMLWWITLSAITRALKDKFLDRGLARLNHISGAVIAISGAAVLAATAFRAFK
jgi:arginine exporter protein ArgO